MPLREGSRAPIPPNPPKIRRRGAGRSIIALIILGAAIGFGGYLLLKPRAAEEAGIPLLAVVKASRSDMGDDLTLSGEFLPYQEVSLHAKVSGYVKKMSVDIGGRVKEGQSIAELEIPELREELKKAAAAVQGSHEDVERAKANYADAHLQFERLTAVAKARPKLIAQQDIDNVVARDNSMAGALGAARLRVEQAQAEESRNKTLLSYASIVAPFDGIITKRFADPGSLIQAGTASNTQSMPLVQLAQDNMLRLVFPAPESVVPVIRVEGPVEFSVDTMGVTMTGKIARFARKVDRATRTMQTEVDVSNQEGRFKPGMYASVRLTLHESKAALSVPVQALAVGDKPSVLVVTRDGLVEQRRVTLGLQTPEMVEIKSGLAEGELVVVGSRNGIEPGQKVRTKITELAKAD